MLQVCKRFTFDAAHLLIGHEGQCKNLHGHTYQVDVVVTHIATTSADNETIKQGPSAGMVVDFKRLKEVANEQLFSLMDHAYIHAEDSTDEITKMAKALGLKTYNMVLRPTAENMATYMADKLDEIFAEHELDIMIVAIRVWETPTSYAEYRTTGFLV